MFSPSHLIFLVFPLFSQDSPYFEAAQTPVPKLLKKVDNIKTGSAVNIPKSHRKVTFFTMN